MTTYAGVMKKIDNDKGNLSIMMSAEYGEFNHYYCSEIVKILKGLDDVWHSPIDEQNAEKLKYYAKQIMDRGGVQALSMNYYVMLKYLAEDNETWLKVKYLEHLFDGVTSKDGEVWRT